MSRSYIILLEKNGLKKKTSNVIHSHKSKSMQLNISTVWYDRNIHLRRDRKSVV